MLYFLLYVTDENKKHVFCIMRLILHILATVQFKVSESAIARSHRV